MCTPDLRCRRWDPCPRCEANLALNEEDWLTVGFYRRVSGQFRNQQPMGAGEGQQPILTPDLASWHAALAIYRYPLELHDWLVDGAKVLHDLVRGMDGVGWIPELEKSLHEMTIEDMSTMAARD